MKLDKHPMWKGADATRQAQRQRAQKMYSLDGVECERAGCTKPAKHRHHINEDTGDNRRENLEFLCVMCHRHTHNPPPPPQPCINCGAPVKRVSPGRCQACSMYRWRTGNERPWKKDGRKEGASGYHPRPPKPPVACSSCGKEARPSRKGKCQRCYDRDRYYAKKAA